MSAAAGGRESGAPDPAGAGPGWQPGAGTGLCAPRIPGGDFKYSGSVAGPKGEEKGRPGGRKGCRRPGPRAGLQSLEAGPGCCLLPEVNPPRRSHPSPHLSADLRTCPQRPLPVASPATWEISPLSGQGRASCQPPVTLAPPARSSLTHRLVTCSAGTQETVGWAWPQCPHALGEHAEGKAVKDTQVLII